MDLYFKIQLQIGVLVSIFCVLFGILGALFGVFSVFCIRKVYLLNLVFGVVYLAFSSQKGRIYVYIL